MVLLLMVQVMFGVSAVPKVTPVPPPTPFEATVLFATMTLLVIAEGRGRVAVTTAEDGGPGHVGQRVRHGTVVRDVEVPLSLSEDRGDDSARPHLVRRALSPNLVTGDRNDVAAARNAEDGSRAGGIGVPALRQDPPALGKLEMTLLATVAVVTLATAPAEPSACSRIPVPLEAAVVVALVIVLPEMLVLLTVPLKF